MKTLRKISILLAILISNFVFTGCEKIVDAYKVSFTLDSHIKKVNVYLDDDFSMLDESTNFYSRDSLGNPMKNGHINFKFEFEDGYEINSIFYSKDKIKQFETPYDLKIENAYRLNNISKQTVIKVTSKTKKQSFDGEVSLVPVAEEITFHEKIIDDYLKGDPKILPEGIQGREEHAMPNPISLSWDVKTNHPIDKVTWEFSEIGTMQNPKVVNVANINNKSVNATNFKINTKYYYRVCVFSDEKVLNSDIYTFKVKDNAPRLIKIDGAHNIRDIGGWKTVDGNEIKQELVYRGGHFNADNYDDYNKDEKIERAKDRPYGKCVTSVGETTIFNDLKLRTEIDLRGQATFDYVENLQNPSYTNNPSPAEIGGLSDGHGLWDEIEYVLCPVKFSPSQVCYGVSGKSCVKKFFSVFAKEENYPIYFHCGQGKDRTGYLAYVLGAFLGMSEDDLIRDYMLSNFSNQGSVSLENNKEIGFNYLEYFAGEMVNYYENGVEKHAQLSGSTLQERVTNFLLDCGVSQDSLNDIKKILLN